MTKYIFDPRRTFAFLAALLLTLGLTTPAFANFTVTVGGVNYRLALVGANDSFANAETEIAANSFVPFKQAPWWQDKSFAVEIAEAVRSLFSAPGASYRAPHNFAQPNELFVQYGYATNGTSGLTGRNVNSMSSNDALSGASQHFWVAEVPEIDGPILAQALFALGALYMLLRGHMSRQRVS